MAKPSILSHELRHYPGLLVIELDPQAADPAGIPPEPLSVAAASALAGHIAKDLDHLLGGIDHLGLILPGALYDQTEILQPGLPLPVALADVYAGSLQGGFVPQVIALGADRGVLPIAELNPQRQPGSGPLLLLPFCLIGPVAAMDRLARVMEDTLLQNGETSPATREAVQQTFGLTALNLSYATLGDLCALLRGQLDGNGLLPLWDLLEHAWLERPGVHPARLDGGNRFLVAGDHAHTVFYTFDDWAQFGPGRECPAAELGDGYRRWVQQQRQYTAALAAYGLEIRWVLANPQLEEILATADAETVKTAMREIPCLSGDYLIEAVFQHDREDPEQQMIVTCHADPELGVLAYTVQTENADGELLRLEHHYPLQAPGLKVIIDRLVQRCAEQGTTRQVRHPGRLLYAESGRSLQTATTTDGPASRKQVH